MAGSVVHAGTIASAHDRQSTARQARKRDRKEGCPVAAQQGLRRDAVEHGVAARRHDRGWGRLCFLFATAIFAATIPTNADASADHGLVHRFDRGRCRPARVARVDKLGVQADDGVRVPGVWRSRPDRVRHVRGAHQQRTGRRGGRKQVFARLWRRHSGSDVRRQCLASLVQAGH